MNFIFNEDPDCVSKNLVLVHLIFTTDLFTNNWHNSMWDFLKDKAVLTILNPAVMSQQTSMSNCFYYVVTIALSVKQMV